MSGQRSIPGPGAVEHGFRFDQVAILGLMSVPDDGVVVGTSGTPRVTLAEIEFEGSGPRGIRALIEGLDARGALTEPPSVLRTPSSLLYAENYRRDTIAVWGLDMAHDRWLHETFSLRPPGSLIVIGLMLPGGRRVVTPEVAHAATDEGRAEWERIRAGLRSSTGGRRGGPPDPADPLGGYDYSQE